MAKTWKWWLEVFGGKGGFEQETVSPKLLPLTEVIERAHAEWLAAKNFFEEVTDPDLVDEAIYRLEATEKRYMHLLRQAKQEQIFKTYSVK
ncbi:YaaL family protein [Calderihabitans maritimus]|uniref:DUF2508 domain-containing protein n=1 Tax=Calderihabitans maritimus TaxID=1246530 RepID=A0A1Z5HWC1_9FIRM|nr:YaaL family protein [Calderihabitans maritimus]GAW93631.1 hypothetical protein Clos_2803 [Calderihabitans maritimus]